MIQTEGVIQYQLTYRPGKLPTDTPVAGLLNWFSICRRHRLIGRDPARYDGYAYGNISIRCKHGFIISGTQTGGLARLTPADLAWVSDFDIGQNQLTASGPARPSSEAMTHGQIYRALPTAKAVIHVHSSPLWRHAKTLEFPITPPEFGYGTPAMANAVGHLLTQRDTNVGIFAMGGHEDGIVAYGPDMNAAGDVLLNAMARAETIENSTTEQHQQSDD